MEPPKYYTIFHRCNGILNNDRPTRNPDELLAKRNNGSVPIRLRDNQFQLPDPELLNVLHYYTSRNFSHLESTLDESALIALGILMEYWVDEIIGDTAQNLYTKYVIDKKKHKKRKIEDKNDTTAEPTNESSD